MIQLKEAKRKYIRIAPSNALDRRNAAIIAAVAAGTSQLAEANRWGISRERVRQVCKTVGLTGLLLREARYEDAKAAIATAPPCYGIRATAKALRMGEKTVRRLGARDRRPECWQTGLTARQAATRREAIRVLRTTYGLTVTEIMAELHLSRGTVCRHLKRIGMRDRSGRPGMTP